MDTTVTTYAGNTQVRRKSSAPAVVCVILLLAGVYIAYQRVGTFANVERIEFNTNFSGGFLAVGMTDSQPGFVLLSMMGREKVTVHAEQYKNGLSGTYTHVLVTTPEGQRRIRLRDAEVILIDRSGLSEHWRVDWTFDEFKRISMTVACEEHDEHSGEPASCGQPFLQLGRFLMKMPEHRVPEGLLAFLKNSRRA